MNRHEEASAQLTASPADLFARLDDQARLAEHMGRPSMMMGGGRMTYAFDAQKGQAVGSHITMGGRAFGLELFVDQVVIEREPPRRKVWRTEGQPKLVIIGGYEMGFEITPSPGGSRLHVWIDYEPPRSGPGRWAPILAQGYARWCVRQMAEDAARHFGSAHQAAEAKLS